MGLYLIGQAMRAQAQDEGNEMTDEKALVRTDGYTTLEAEQKAEIERLRGEIDEQRKLRNHFAEQAAHWNALYAAERQRADHAEAEWGRMSTSTLVVDFGPWKSTIERVSRLLDEADKEYAAMRQRARLPEGLVERVREMLYHCWGPTPEKEQSPMEALLRDILAAVEQDQGETP